MQAILSGPFSFLANPDLGLCNDPWFCNLMASLPSWFQAAFLEIVVGVLALALLVLAVLGAETFLRLFFKFEAKDVVSAMFIFFFLPPVAGVVAGGASLVFGVQHTSVGFAIGGAVVLGITCLLLLVLLGFMRRYWFPILAMVAGLSAAYYGLQFTSSVFAIGGGVLLGVGLIWGQVVATQP